MLTFEEIKQKCVPGESVLVNSLGNERLFVAFRKHDGLLITENIDNGLVDIWHETQIKHWSIKPKTKKIVVEQWINIYPNGIGASFNNEQNADLAANGSRLDCFHFRKEYEVPCE